MSMILFYSTFDSVQSRFCYSLIIIDSNDFDEYVSILIVVSEYYE
jgi:hypothetical protein